MAKKVLSLGVKRVDKTHDCRDWSVLDALRSCIKDIEAGDLSPDMVFIAMRDRDETDSNTVKYLYVAAGGTNIELTGLVSQHLHRLCTPLGG